MPLIEIVYLSAAVATITLILTRSTLLHAVRAWIKSRNEMAGELVSCPFCMSVWVSLAMAYLYRIRPLQGSWPYVDYAIGGLVLVVLSNVLAYVVFKAIGGMELGDG